MNKYSPLCLCPSPSTPTHALNDMDYSFDFDLPNCPHGLNCSEQKEREKIMEDSTIEGLFELGWLPPPQLPSNQLCCSEFKDLENFSCDFEFPPLGEDFLVDKKSLNIVGPTTGHCHCESFTSGIVTSVKKEEEENKDGARNSRKKCSSKLEFEEIKKHFDVPITEAAKQMNVGLTLLKRRCRELNIMRWPHRKIKSLNSLIHDVKELGLSKELAMLEQNKRLVEKIPDMKLDEKTRKLRQACLKANYKRRRSLSLQA